MKVEKDLINWREGSGAGIGARSCGRHLDRYRRCLRLSLKRVRPLSCSTGGAPVPQPSSRSPTAVVKFSLDQREGRQLKELERTLVARLVRPLSHAFFAISA